MGIYRISCRLRTCINTMYICTVHTMILCHKKVIQQNWELQTLNKRIPLCTVDYRCWRPSLCKASELLGQVEHWALLRMPTKESQKYATLGTLSTLPTSTHTLRLKIATSSLTTRHSKWCQFDWKVFLSIFALLYTALMLPWSARLQGALLHKFHDFHPSV